jgi:hypothetical protein
MMYFADKNGRACGVGFIYLYFNANLEGKDVEVLGR